MGCDIHTITQERLGETYWYDTRFTPFDWRGYGMYGFLADVRNYSEVPPLSTPRGLPIDFQIVEDRHGATWMGDYSYSWFLLSELLNFDYKKTFLDKREGGWITPNFFDGAAKGEGVETTFEDFLRPCYFRDLNYMKQYCTYNNTSPDNYRIVFGFDS